MKRTSLSGPWTIWFDIDAAWASEQIHLPHTKLSEILAHQPSGGWTSLESGIPITVPAITDDLRPAYHGVSWWSRKIFLSGLAHAVLRFEAVRLRAEIYLDGELIGYDIEGYTPFEINIPAHLNKSGEHRLDVRVTNPGGSDNWEDLNPIRWSGVTLPSSQDFGGIWQPVTLIEHAGLRIADLWVTPSLARRTVQIVAELEGAGATAVQIRVQSPDGVEVCAVRCCYDQPRQDIDETVQLDHAEPYSIGDAKLYQVTLIAEYDGLTDTATQKCGFRALTIDNGTLNYNGHPIYLATSISWSQYFNGPIATAAEIENEVSAIKQMGQNMLTAHRRPANPALIDALDDAGLLLYQEPGGLPSLRDRMGCGNWLPAEELHSALAFAQLRIERLWRRDRSRACLVWWNLANECLDVDTGYAGEPAEMLLRAARQCDNSRITSWTSGWGPSPAYGSVDERQTATFDFHTVLNWPSIWHPQLDAEIASIRPAQTMPYISGESQNFTSLSGLTLLAEAAKARKTKRPSDHKLIAWHETLHEELEAIDPKNGLGGLDAFCAATAAVQTEGVARLVRHHRANSDCDGLAINGWHGHPQIGTMGIVQVDRALSVDARAIADANAPIQIMLRSVRYDVSPGSKLCIEPIILNQPHRVNLPYNMRVRLGEIELAAPIIGQTSGARCDALSQLDITIPNNIYGTHRLSISGHVGDHAVSDHFTILVTPDSPLDLSAIDLFDPRDELSSMVGRAGTAWRLGTDAPSLLCANNLRVVQALLDGKPRKSAVLMRPDLPGASNIMGAPGDLAKHGLASSDARFVEVKGDWNGGWAFSTGDRSLPSLSLPCLWTSHHWRIFPRYMMVGVQGVAITGATSFEDATLYDTGQLRTGATTMIVEKHGCKVLLTTLPLTAAISSSPLARSLVKEIADWLVS
jgi:beta-galactosidase